MLPTLRDALFKVRAECLAVTGLRFVDLKQEFEDDPLAAKEMQVSQPY